MTGPRENRFVVLEAVSRVSGSPSSAEMQMQTLRGTDLVRSSHPVQRGVHS